MVAQKSLNQQTIEERANERWQELDVESELDLNEDEYETHYQFDAITGEHVMTSKTIVNSNRIDLDSINVIATPVFGIIEVMDSLMASHEESNPMATAAIRHKPTAAEWEHNMGCADDERIPSRSFTGNRSIRFIESTSFYPCSWYNCEAGRNGTDEIQPGDTVVVTRDWDNPDKREFRELSVMCTKHEHVVTPKEEYVPAGALHDSTPVK